MKQQVSCQKAAGVSYSNQTEIAECIWTKGAPMRAKPRCGHGVSFSKKQEGQAANCFFRGGRQRQSSQPCDCCVPVLNRIGRGLAIVLPATIAHAAALPAFGHAEVGSDASAPNRSNNLRAVQVGMVAALLTAGNANESTEQKTHTGHDRTSDPKSIFIPRGSDSVPTAHPPFGWLGTDARTRYHYRAAVDLG